MHEQGAGLGAEQVGVAGRLERVVRASVGEQAPAVLSTPSGLRFRLLRARADTEEAEVLGDAIDRLAALESGDQPGSWTRSARPGSGRRAWPEGTRWSTALRSNRDTPD